MWENPRQRSWAAEVTLTDTLDAMMREVAQLRRQNRIGEAIALYQRILAKWPGLAESWFNLAVLQRQTRQFEAALVSYQRALDAGVSQPEEAHLNRSVIYTDYLRRHGEAERELRCALALNPVFIPALLNLGNLCEDLGRRHEAREIYEHILTIEPRNFVALARCANLQPASSAAPELLARIRLALTDATLSTEDRAGLGFALGRLLDQAGEYHAAFDAYHAANNAGRASAAAHGVRYNQAQHSALIDRLIAGGLPVTRAASAATVPGPQPIFICGMFRSGSTLAEHLLASGAAAAGGEIDFLPLLVERELAPFPESLATLSAERLEAIAARYRTELARVSRSALYVIDKRPDNFLYLGLIKKLFPDARIVHTVRDPLDNCLSIYFLYLDARMSYAFDLRDIGHYFREYRRLMAHWKRTFPGDIFDLNYDVLVREPETTLQRLRAFLGLEDDAAKPQSPAGVAIKTASVWQVREPLYRSSSGRAKHYADELKELREFLADLP
jgi:tetratricopeptide (TPR) repeat protein